MYNYGDQVLINLVSADSLYYIAMHKNMWFWHNCSMQICNMILLLQTCLCQGEMIKEIFFINFIEHGRKMY